MTKAGSSSKQHTGLATIGFDVLSVIASHLDVRSLARLEQTCKSLNVFATQHGWHCIAARYRRKNDKRANDKSIKDHVRVDVAWARRTFDVTESEIGLENEAGTKDNVPFSKLLLLAHGLVLIVRSELHYWPNAFLEGRQTISLTNAQSFYLCNPANLDTAWQRKQRHASRSRKWLRPSATWDISMCGALDDDGRTLALARVNGLVEVISLDEGAGGHLRITLAWLWTDLLGQVELQTMATCPRRGLFALCSKGGDVWLLKVKRNRTRKARLGINVEPLYRFSVGRRIWSAAFTAKRSFETDKDPLLLALGTKGEEGIIIYHLDPRNDLTPNRIFSLPCGVSPAYALAFDRSQTYLALFAGCFDGVLRVYNVTEALTDGRRKDPRWQHRDLADSSAIYSLVTNVGLGNGQVAVGTARHGVIKMYDPYLSSSYDLLSLPDANSRGQHDESQGWTIFASYPARSPTYTIVGQHDRLFGATDSKIWQIDLRPRRLKEEHRQAGRVAYYRHSKVYLETSTRPEIL